MPSPMAVQKSSGGGGGAGRPISRRQRYLIWAVLAGVSLVLFQFWSYKQTWATEETEMQTDSSMLIRSWFTSKDITKELITFREIVTLCNSTASTEENQRECLMKLMASFPSLKPSLLSAQGLQLESCLDGPQKARLQEEVDKLGTYMKESTVFLPLLDRKEVGQSDTDTTWFMSSIHWENMKSGLPEEFEFPSELSKGRLLCLMGNNISDGTQNKYGFAFKGYLPSGAKLLPGLTLVADNYWDYNNIWHGMNALVPFVSWRGRNGCGNADRLLLYHWGEVVPSIGSWVDHVLHASFGRKLEIETLEHSGDGESLVCLERAVVNRRGLGRMSNENMNDLFEMIRCRSRKYCGVVMVEGNVDPNIIHVTLFLRSGARAFRNASAVRSVIDGVCGEVGDCRLEVAYANNLSFCEQVALMSRTDVLVTTHGAQMTNMMFMSKGGSVMEFIPKGWLEFAGIGQYIYAWMASWSNIHHEGVWRDPEGPDCPFPHSETLKCLLFHKDLEVGHNETHLTEWTREVLKNFRERRRESTALGISKSYDCTCDQQDPIYTSPLSRMLMQ